MTTETGKQKYQTNVNAADYSKGVNATTVSPGQKAAAQKTKMQNNTVAAEADMLKGLQDTPLEDWQTPYIAAIPHMQEKTIAAVNNGSWNADKILQAGNNASAAAGKLPKMTMNDSWNRYKAAQDAIITAHGGKV